MTHSGPLHPPNTPVTHCSYAGLAGTDSRVAYQPTAAEQGLRSSLLHTTATGTHQHNGLCHLPSHIPGRPQPSPCALIPTCALACMTHLRLCSRVIQALLHLFLRSTLTTVTCLPLFLDSTHTTISCQHLHLHLDIVLLEHLQSASSTNVTVRLR